VEPGEIWSTEHGPQGGDELNLLEAGRDYGWPRATYGTAYGQKDWPLAQGQERHGVGTKPVFAWVPSIAVSSLIRLRGTAFPAWRDDLLVGSLGGLGHGDALFRVELDGARVAFVERIPTGRPVRDLIELDDGRLLLWNGDGTVQTLEPATHVFAPCSGCHALRWASHGVGPDLMGVVGRRVASHERFAYSDALRRVGGRWSRARLDGFLRDPAGFAPGTSMEYPGLPDASARATLLDYLEDVARDASGRGE
jgi:cytochrome c2